MDQMKSLLLSTEGGKAGTIDGLNLFFGALLGANLGTLGQMSLAAYAQLIVLLAGLVMALRMLSTSPKRAMMLSVIGLYAVLLAGIAMVPALHPEGMPVGDLHRLAVTLGIWLVFVVAAELAPMEKPERVEEL
jgi:uncharacterized membrane protein